jgi:hypothetical protein
MHDELVAIKKLVEEAAIATDAKRTACWCLDQLPALYLKLFDTYDSRFRDEILRLEQALLKPFARQTKKVGDAIREQLQALHTRLGFEGLKREAA